MSDRIKHIIDRQTAEAMATLGRTVRMLVRNKIDPTPLFAAVERACREAQSQVEDRAA